MIKLTEWLSDVRIYDNGRINQSGAQVVAWVEYTPGMKVARWPTMPHKVMVF